jgi:hypothetical protein
VAAARIDGVVYRSERLRREVASHSQHPHRRASAPYEVATAHRNSALRRRVVVLDGTPHTYERVDEVVDLVAVKQVASVADLKLGRTAALLVLCERDTERLHGFGHVWNVTTFARVPVATRAGLNTFDNPGALRWRSRHVAAHTPVAGYGLG